MGQISVKASQILNARAEAVYAAIADYRDRHPRILPKENLHDLQVEQGGYGAGTVMRFRSRILGVEQSFYQRVSEPEPGRVLVEQDIEPGQQHITTFSVLPINQGRQSQVEITTKMNASRGLQGLSERLIFALMIPRIYRKELRLLEAVAQQTAIA